METRTAVVRDAVVHVVLVALCAAVLLALPHPAARAQDGPRAGLPADAGSSGLPAASRAPLPGEVVTAFDPPSQKWQAGHRGVDLAGSTGQTVRASAAGTITYAGVLAGRGVVVVTHGEVRTTYEPVAASVAVGDRVGLGDPIGTLQAGHASCPTRTCLHWGLRRGEEYLDPTLLGVGHGGHEDVRLVGEARIAEARRAASDRAAAEQAARHAAAGDPGPGPGAGANGPPVAPGSWHAPVNGPITSSYGMRVHPVTGIYKLHDGTDYGAPCGAPIRSPLGGRVTQVTYHGAYGWRAFIDHGTVNGRHLVTSMNHATHYVVRPGQSVSAGQLVGHVGTTGWSTGCHLHLMAWSNGQLVNPATLG